MADLKKMSMLQIAASYGTTVTKLYDSQGFYSRGYRMADCMLCHTLKTFLMNNRAGHWYFFCFACKRHGNLNELQAFLLKRIEESAKPDSGSITAVKFSESRFEEKGVTSRDEGMRIREQVKQLGEWEEDKI